MGIKTMTLKDGGTCSVTGGTDLVFADDGQTVQNGVHSVVPADSSYATRRQMTAKYNAPTLSPQGEFNRDRKSVSLTVPMTTAAGKVVYNVIRVERQVHPEFADADCVKLNSLCAQALFDSETTSFWAAGSLS
jgi:hypothetical protein